MTGPTPSSADQPGQELAGHLGVEATARRVRYYRYAEEQLRGRQVWDCAQHADQWGKRLPELRAPAQVSEPSGPEFVGFLDALESREAWAETIERLTGVYRVLKPHLIDAYAAHLARVNPVYEPPTRRILERCLADERRHVTEGVAALDALTREPRARERMLAWERELRARLETSGGVAGRPA